MDVFCKHCDEPCDVWHLNNDMEPHFREMFKAGKGCDICEGKGSPSNSKRSDAMGLLQDMLGDDIDGIASMMDDFDFMGMLE